MVERDDRVLPLTRRVGMAIVPFLVVAFVVLFFFPGDTGRLFAWTIVPPMTASVLGAVYLGGAYFFVRVARATTWHEISAGFVPVGIFAAMIGIATAVHWEKFNHDHVAFWLWAGLYFTTPFAIFATWAANRRHAGPVTDGGAMLGPGVRVVIGAVGVAALATSLTLFGAPERLISTWPWMLTPLTARVMAAVFALGAGGILVAADPRWRAARLLFQVEGIILVAFVVAGVRSRGDLELSSILSRTLVAGLGATLLAGAVLYRRMERSSASRAR